MSSKNEGLDYIREKFPDLDKLIKGNTWEHFCRTPRELLNSDVYKVKKKTSDEYVALKCMSTENQAENIIQELKVLRDFSEHDNIVDFYGVYISELMMKREKKFIWIAMEYCEGNSLRDIYDFTEKPFEESSIAYIMKKLVTVIEYLHDNGVIHCAISGPNILLTGKGAVKLANFYLAVDSCHEGTLTRPHKSVPWACFTPPEIVHALMFENWSYDMRWDIWSLGITCIELAQINMSNIDCFLGTLIGYTRNQFKEIPSPGFNEPNRFTKNFRDFVSKLLKVEPTDRSYAKDLHDNLFISKASDEVDESTLNRLQEFREKWKIVSEKREIEPLPDEVIDDSISEEDEISTRKHKTGDKTDDESDDATDDESDAKTDDDSSRSFGIPKMLQLEFISDSLKNHQRLLENQELQIRTKLDEYELALKEQSQLQKKIDEEIEQMESDLEQLRKEQKEKEKHEQDHKEKREKLWKEHKKLREVVKQLQKQQLEELTREGILQQKEQQQQEQQLKYDELQGDFQGIQNMLDNLLEEQKQQEQEQQQQKERIQEQLRLDQQQLQQQLQRVGNQYQQLERVVRPIDQQLRLLQQQQHQYNEYSPPSSTIEHGWTRIFEGCTLKINAIALWNNSRNGPLLLIGSNEGIYCLNLDDQDNQSMRVIFQYRCLWLAVHEDVIISLSYRGLYQHDLRQAFSDNFETMGGAESSRLSEVSATTVINKTEGCMRVSLCHNQENNKHWFACALPDGVLLLQWENRSRRFLEIEKIQVADMPQPLLTFETFICQDSELPLVCVGVLPGRDDNHVRFRIIDFNRREGKIELFPSDQNILVDDDDIDTTCVRQINIDHVLVCYKNLARQFDLMSGCLLTETSWQVPTLSFNFTIENAQCRQNSLYSFHKHGFQATALTNGEVLQLVYDPNRVYRVVGFSNNCAVLESRSAKNPMANCDLLMLADKHNH